MDLLMKEPTAFLGTLLGGAILWYPNFVHDTTITAMLAIQRCLGFTYIVIIKSDHLCYNYVVLFMHI
jgi:hypothetical protein